jgi:hypothetical protein
MRFLRSVARIVSTGLYALSLSLFILSVFASRAKAVGGNCEKRFLAGEWYCGGTDNCKPSEGCIVVTQGSGWICDCG